MDAELTLTIDKETKEKVFLNNEEIVITPRIKKMIGQLKVTKNFDYKEELTDALINKYLDNEQNSD
ncbi:MAG TPA: hypothetical protein PKY56_10150 [Candidatus Kapabacteria bacterium]|mgnify:CR=1 FL=1|nr:hypothetical protein [Candidatus Kapabacteria bacterium]HPO63743.1 hypothetical protein [Candidatus Kapabacteria bacterium]